MATGCVQAIPLSLIYQEVLWDHYDEDEAALPQSACYNTYLLELLLLGLQERIVLTQKVAVDVVFPWAVGDTDIHTLSSQVALHFSSHLQPSVKEENWDLQKCMWLHKTKRGFLSLGCRWLLSVGLTWKSCLGFVLVQMEMLYQNYCLEIKCGTVSVKICQLVTYWLL